MIIIVFNGVSLFFPESKTLSFNFRSKDTLHTMLLCILFITATVCLKRVAHMCKFTADPCSQPVLRHTDILGTFLSLHVESSAPC